MPSIEQRGENTFRITISITQKDGSYIRERVIYKPDISNLKKKTPAAQKKEILSMVEEYAKKYEERRKYELEVLEYDVDQLTFRKVAEMWQADASFKNLTLRVQEDYIRMLNVRVYPYLEDKIINRITKPQIMMVVNKLVDQNYSASTIRKVFVAINSVFKYAYDMEFIDRNPCGPLFSKLPKKEKKTGIHCFNVEQTKIFLEILETGYEVYYCEHDTIIKKTGEVRKIQAYKEIRKIPTQLKCFYYLAIYGGFRRGELLALNWHDINFDMCTINITKAVSETKTKGQIIKDPKSYAGNRLVCLPEICFKLLRQWYEEEKELARSMGTAWHGIDIFHFEENRLFIQLDGKPMCGSTPYQRFKDILRGYNDSCDRKMAEAKTPQEKKEIELQKLPDITLHELRHTQASILASSRISAATIAKRLGHSEATTTEKWYIHALDAEDALAVLTIEEKLKIE